MKSPSFRTRRAFTLVEVLVSLAIFAMAAVALSLSYLNVIGSYRALSNRHAAEEDWKLVRATVLAEPERAKVEEGGRISLADGREVTWTAKIEQAEVADLFLLTLEAGAPGTGNDPEWTQRETLYLLRPTWSEAVDRDRLRAKTQERVQREQRS